ncbi:HesB/IscA family protein [endosymbiont of Ridgeia piscesae]|jgi:iron-sulfur cluster assembly protein|uniref:Fe-S cluster assembly iron-binding protein IscA n=1 Tax=endosymbiont of Ridgeia piscesae TaxID=54398 RepID=A0A0T5YYA2_9GAMM|nr:iron-sulfur cluster biosynthesis family protein [endosymbiont of Ridgeia piscesae]KRT55586.1 Fe-S cluster assembly iron-binding protein IscA [endosymbiont of Ridgeia piscesae]KRT58183.1 iron-sulfur cluster assembly protein [endosymbiont of Ridgeia piscesae]
MFKLTKQAAEQIIEAARQGGTEGMALRFAARRKEDGSFDYLMGFDEAKEDDIRFTSEGISIVIEPEYVPLLDETTMDYAAMEDGENKFIFINPKDANYTPLAD